MNYLHPTLFLIFFFFASITSAQTYQVTVEKASSSGFLSDSNGSNGYVADHNVHMGFYAVRNDRGGYAQENTLFGFGADFNGTDGFFSGANQSNGYFASQNGSDGFESRNNMGDGLFTVFNQANGISSTDNIGFGIYSADNGMDDGYFEGNVTVNGSLSKAAGSFKIDHPLDPENKYLYHSFVESPDMMNIYNGNIITDERGLAKVTLPDWFDSLNRDFRYQLTVIGTFAQAVIKSKMINNQFVIMTNEPHIEVSWQVTGIRQDPYANENRIPVEKEKEEKYKGRYIHYKAYNQPYDKSFIYVNRGHKTIEEMRNENDELKKSIGQKLE